MLLNIKKLRHIQYIELTENNIFNESKHNSKAESNLLFPQLFIFLFQTRDFDLQFSCVCLIIVIIHDKDFYLRVALNKTNAKFDDMAFKSKKKNHLFPCSRTCSRFPILDHPLLLPLNGLLCHVLR